MVTKLLNEVNENIKTLNNLVQDKEYFEKLDERIEKVNNYVQEQKKEIERLNNIINKAKDKSIDLQNKYGYILDDLTYLLMQGSDKECN